MLRVAAVFPLTKPEAHLSVIDTSMYHSLYHIIQCIISFIDTSKALNSGWGSVNDILLKILTWRDGISLGIFTPLCGSDVLPLLHQRFWLGSE